MKKQQLSSNSKSRQSEGILFPLFGQLMIYMRVTLTFSIVSLVVSIAFILLAITDRTLINASAVILPSISNMVTGLLFVQVRFLSKQVEVFYEQEQQSELINGIKDDELRDQTLADVARAKGSTPKRSSTDGQKITKSRDSKRSPQD
jgi:hypothetical protein